MANTTVASANNVEQWDRSFFQEWVRGDQFAPYTSKSTNAVIQVREQLASMPGDQITMSLVTRLTGAGISGDNTLEGNEEALGNYGYKLTIAQIRQAVTIGKAEQKKTHIDMLKAASPVLMNWRLDHHRDDVIAAFLSPHVDGSTAYASASEANKDAWQTANSDRVLFGSAVGNSTNDHSADLAKVDSTNDTLDTGILDLGKRLAKLADPHIRPVRVDGQGEFFVWFVGSYAMRDLRADSAMQQANRDAMMRGKSNPLFVDGDLMWGGNIVHEVPEIDVLSGVGASSIDVAPCFCAGAQALGYAIGERTHSIKEESDYGNIKGVGVAEMRSVQKLMMNEVQHGLVTVYVSGVADS